MDEFTRDLMAGEGGLEAVNGAMEGNLGKWAEGAAEQQLARQANPPPPGMYARSVGPGFTRFHGLLLVIAFIALMAVLFAAR
jgi:hypothetical protein